MPVTMREMLEAGVHFGHQTRYWNPRMAPYIFGHRNKIHIVNLEKTMEKYLEALKFVRRLATNKGTVLFVGTKRQAREIIKEEATRCGAPDVDYRWEILSSEPVGEGRRYRIRVHKRGPSPPVEPPNSAA